MTEVLRGRIDDVTRALHAANSDGRIGLVPFLTAGYPDRESFRRHLVDVAASADVVEIGVPFSDPMADGVTIQRSSRAALEAGTSLTWILETLEALRGDLSAPVVLMSYLNPLLAYGPDLANDAARAGVSGFIVPDLPLEESTVLRQALEQAGLGLVQLVTPVTPPERLARLCEASRGFVYAVTMTGTTGKRAGGEERPSHGAILDYLDRVRMASALPICAGFGIRAAEQVARIRDHADGVIVGSALIEAIERGEDPAVFLEGLRAGSGGEARS